jgi:hypothetical protein
LLYSLHLLGIADNLPHSKFGTDGDCAYANCIEVASIGGTFAIASDLSYLSPQYGIVVSILMPSGTSRMRDSP